MHVNYFSLSNATKHIARDLEEQRASVADCFSGLKRDIALAIMHAVDSEDLLAIRPQTRATTRK